MGLLKKLGLAQKKREGAPMIGESRKKEQDAVANRKKVYIRWAIFVSFLLVLFYSLPNNTFRQMSSYTLEEPWRADDLIAPFTFALNKSPAELEAEREQIRANTPLIFHINENARVTSQSRFDSLYNELEPVLDAYLQWQRARNNPDVSAANDSLRFLQQRNSVDLELTNSSWEFLLDSYATVHIENQPTSEFIGTQIRNRINDLITSMMNSGIINLSKEDLETDEITVRDLSQRTERTISVNNVRDLDEAREHAHFEFSRIYSTPGVNLARELFQEVLLPNWIYNEEDTQARLAEAMENISRTKGAIAQGEVIIRRGDIVTEDRANILRSLSDARADTATDIERWVRFLGDILILTISSLFFLIYLYLYRRQIYESSSMFLLVFLVMAIVSFASGIVYSFDNISAFIVPIAIAPLILTIIFDSRVGLMAAVTLAIVTAIFHDNHFEYLIATILACSFGVFSVRDINKRTQFFVTTPFVIILGYLLVLSGFALTRYGGWENLLDNLSYVTVNAVFILFTYPLILFFEKTFNITTDFTLLELSDTNLPLLKELMNKAPGSFHHSLQVSNLAESAASAIGANALKCRVGALYHDIGKIKKPGYFIENQTGHNEHNNLKPRMSALVIKAHVSDGVKMAQENNLPETIIEFIRTHHGTSLIKYFYDKAQKNSTNESEIQEEDFRYDGPIPSTRETGILMLADSVEAACRSMKDPTYSKLENLINRIVDDYVHEGQMNHCPLTFHQLDIIKKTFLNIQVGVYHSRIEYPDDEEKSSKTEKKQAGEATEPDGSRQTTDQKPPAEENGANPPDGSGSSGEEEHRPDNQP
ncbi:MAG: HDIG domain-containing metalloprotein [Balneolaceae bacterium]